MSPQYQRFGGVCAVLTGVVGFLYSVSFVIITRASHDTGTLLSGLFLLLGGLLGSAALVALYMRTRDVDEGFALWALLLSIVAVLGSAVHGAFDMANVIHRVSGGSSRPSEIDPRGVLTFGVAGLAILVLSWLISRESLFPRGLAFLGYLSGVLLIIIYLARLIILSAKNPVVVGPAAHEGFIVNPAWYIWLGLSLWQQRIPS